VKWNNNTATGQATVTGPRGASTTMSGAAMKEGDMVSGDGTATGPRGKTITGSGTVTKEGDQVSGSGTVTGPQGQTATVSGSGNKEAGNVTVDTAKGTSSVTWDDDTVTGTNRKGATRSRSRR